ncbi:MAG: hypothetical protein ABH952_03825 [Candidatus Omnitrophota bacterium]
MDRTIKEEYMRLEVLLNILLSGLSIYIKILYGSMHAGFINLMKNMQLNGLLSRLIEVNSRINFLSIFLGLISLSVAFLILTKKLCNRYVALSNFIMAIISFLFCLVAF